MLAHVLGALLLVSAVNAPPELNDQTFQRWLNHVRPAPEELRWQEIPWRPAFWEAVQEAQAQEKPILLWAMNGHPLACT